MTSFPYEIQFHCSPIFLKASPFGLMSTNVLSVNRHTIENSVFNFYKNKTKIKNMVIVLHIIIAFFLNKDIVIY